MQVELAERLWTGDEALLGLMPRSCYTPPLCRGSRGLDASKKLLLELIES